MRKIARWKIDFKKELEKLSNRELYEGMLYAQVPDDWDGAFTSRGADELTLYLEVLEERLSEWLKN